MEKSAQAAESLVARSSGQVALDHAIHAADLYMRAAQQATQKTEATRLRKKCRQLITLAECLKADMPDTHPGLHAKLLYQSSRLHGNDFPPWTVEPADADFQLSPGRDHFVDKVDFTLSPKQTATFDSWKRPQDLLDGAGTADERSFMSASETCDLVQDLTTDCSVVASLCAAMRIMTGPNSVLSSVFYPYDQSTCTPKLSPSGKYIMRFYFNGSFRRVVIDERLPASLTNRTLFVVDRNNPMLIWPALLEKAYLKVRGGYDFPGSNSGTDLWVLTGWIPEQIFLQREDFDADATWKRIKAAYEKGDVVVTLGTGRISREEETTLGLIGEHDYAVMDLDTAGDIHRMLVKNPWCNGPVWKGGRTHLQQDQGSTATPDLPGNDEAAVDVELTVSSFWMPLHDVAQHFESMYLNWNPALFKHRQDHHFTWKLPPKRLSSSLVRNPQFSVESTQGGTVWVLISRHFMDAELEISQTRTESITAASQQLGFMGILVFEGTRRRVQLNDGASYRGPYVDSPQTLACLHAKPRRQYIVALDQHELPLSRYTFTISFFSNQPLITQEADDVMQYSKEVTGNWNRRTAGGNAACPTFCLNPQFKLALQDNSSLSILLSTDQQDVPVHVDLVWAQGKRVTTVKLRDQVGSSGEYRRGCAVADLSNIDAGTYTLVCSTFDAGQRGDFALRVSSRSPVLLEPIPPDAAGQLRTPLTPFKLSRGGETRRAILSVTWLTRMNVTAKSISHKGKDILSTLLVRLTVVHGWAPERAVLAVSGDGEFTELKSIVRTPDLNMEPEQCLRQDVWLIVESLGSQAMDECIEVELHSDAPIRIGPWEKVE